MAETATVPQTPAPVVQEQQPPVVKKEVDLITKVSQFKKQEPVAPPETSDPELANFDFKSIENIKDPSTRGLFIKYYKDEQRKFTKKFQEVADQRKALEAERNTPWTPERIDNLLKDQTFLNAAQQVASSKNEKQTDSLLNEEEQAKLERVSVLENELKQIRSANYQATVSQKDTELKNRFSDYDPIVVDNGIRDLSQMQPHQIREYVWKAVNYERDVQRAYELAKQERNSSTQDKINSLTSVYGGATPADSLPERKKGQSSQDYFLEIAQRRLEESKRK